MRQRVRRPGRGWVRDAVVVTIGHGRVQPQGHPDVDLVRAFGAWHLEVLNRDPVPSWALSYRLGHSGPGTHVSVWPAEAREHLRTFFREYHRAHPLQPKPSP